MEAIGGKEWATARTEQQAIRSGSTVEHLTELADGLQLAPVGTVGDFLSVFAPTVVVAVAVKSCHRAATYGEVLVVDLSAAATVLNAARALVVIQTERAEKAFLFTRLASRLEFGAGNDLHDVVRVS